ncbi:MAG: long-chain fatty acid--CoA ligase [Steroidobacteraceae bacterium]
MLSTMQDGELSVARLLQHGASVHGDSGVRTWTGTGSRVESYRELGARAARLANVLRKLSVTGGQRVGTFMWNNNEHMEAYVAVPAMGAVLHTLNIRLFPEQLIYTINHADDHVIIVDANLLALFTQLLPWLKSVRHVVVANGDKSALDAPPFVAVHGYDELLAAESEEFSWPRVDEHSAAAMCYTSGTTGDPKGVAYSHRSIWLHAMQLCMTDGFGITQGDVVLAITPMFHAMSWGAPYAALMVGASLVMTDRFLQPAAIAAMLAAEKPNIGLAVPTIWQGLLTYLETHAQDISPLKRAVLGGSACPASLMRSFADRYGVEVLQAWGMTETSPLGTVAHAPAAARGEQALAYRLTQGRFPAGVRARIVDDRGKELPWDGKTVGQLEVGGPWVTARYYSPDTPACVAQDTTDSWLRTGDVGHISPDGFLTLTDRAKDVIKSGGEWISSIQLENAVMAHPAVSEAAVIAIPDEKWQERPLVAVVLRQGAHASANELRAFLVGKLAKWQLPENWCFIDEVPKTSVGKFDKKRLRARYADGELNVQCCPTN